jgi:hypothetical protein
LIDFTNCKTFIKGYGGANGSKLSIEYNNEMYMLKFPPTANNKKTTLSYINSTKSEHIGCTIFNMLGIPAQKTLLGIFNKKDKQYIVCACKDLESQSTLTPFSYIKNTVVDSPLFGDGTELNKIYEAFEEQNYFSVSYLKDFFWDMFIVDALIGNFDRHNGNWGFLVYNNASIEISPIYDCGSCMLPQADIPAMTAMLSSETEMNNRIYLFPTSAIKVNNKKLNYFEYIYSLTNIDCNNALSRVFPKIKINDIIDFINSIDLLTDLEKRFYSEYVKERYNKILKYSYESLLSNLIGR